MREMYYTSRPIEMTDRDLLLSTLKAIDAENTLMCSSDWPHWDFDTPGGRIMAIDGISERQGQHPRRYRAACARRPAQLAVSSCPPVS